MKPFSQAITVQRIPSYLPFHLNFTFYQLESDSVPPKSDTVSILIFARQVIQTSIQQFSSIFTFEGEGTLPKTDTKPLKNGGWELGDYFPLKNILVSGNSRVYNQQLRGFLHVWSSPEGLEKQRCMVSQLDACIGLCQTDQAIHVSCRHRSTTCGALGVTRQVRTREVCKYIIYIYIYRT